MLCVSNRSDDDEKGASSQQTLPDSIFLKLRYTIYLLDILFYDNKKKSLTFFVVCMDFRLVGFWSVFLIFFYNTKKMMKKGVLVPVICVGGV